ncbi:LAFE_0A06194g1_1 [Lachancea fermentati]|uniref:Maintenance of mitochondrial morphology protein 1 n=1 Tax=Lachancea fermentati TaxID=4955 RepID=A0A1G4M722_LACFM|nr:LAFE_0A06194g1_1 [Lachancea fermentati]
MNISPSMDDSSQIVDVTFTASQTDNETFIASDENINYMLSQLQRSILENLELHQQEVLDSTSKSRIDAVLNALSQQQIDNSLTHSLNSASNSGSSFSSWSFTEGLIIGQLSVILVLIFFIKFFIFSEVSPKNEGSNASTSAGASVGSVFSSSALLSSSTSQFLSSIIKRETKDGVDMLDEKESDRSTQINSILEKTYYNVDTHSPESLDWFNVLIAQTIQQFREEALQKDNIINSLNDLVGRKSAELPNYLDSIKITELSIGEDFPILSNCRIQYSPNSNRKRLEAKIDIDLSDRLTLGIETKLLINYPKPFTAALPVQLTVSVIRFQACLTVSLTTDEEFVPTSTSEMSENADDGSGYFLMFSFAPEYRMEFDIKSLIGARSKLQNIPKVSSFIEYQIKKWFVERCVEPRFQFIRLPSLWPRSKNTREEKTDGDDVSMKSNEF